MVLMPKTADSVQWQHVKCDCHSLLLPFQPEQNWYTTAGRRSWVLLECGKSKNKTLCSVYIQNVMQHCFKTVRNLCCQAIKKKKKMTHKKFAFEFVAHYLKTERQKYCWLVKHQNLLWRLLWWDFKSLDEGKLLKCFVGLLTFPRE